MVEASPEPASRRGLAGRLVAAFRLEPALYDEVEHDPRALGQAAGVVAAGGLAQGIARFGETGAAGLLAGPASALALWVVAGVVVRLVGVRWFRGTSDLPELLRTLGFAAAPLLLLVLCGLLAGPAATLVYIVAHGLATVAFFVAVRQALDVDTGRALAVCAVVLAVGLGFLLGIGLVFGAWSGG